MSERSFMTDIEKKPELYEDEIPLSQLIVEIIAEAQKMKINEDTDKEYFDSINQLINALLDGKRISATAIQNTAFKSFGYCDEIFRWQAPEEVTSISGTFKSAYVQAGRINITPEPDDTQLPEVKATYDYAPGQLFWDVTIINPENRDDIQQISEIQIS
jgi:hypothetical protein